MEKSFQTRVAVVSLALATAAAIIFALFNFLQEGHYQLPTDGVWWTEAHGGLEAQRVLKGSAGQRAGVKTGDLLVAANDTATPRWSVLVRQMWETKVYGTIHYTLIRNGVRLIDVPVILDTQDRSLNQGFRLIALVYLGIGLYVLFRRWTAPHATHFYLFCLASFVLYSFRYTGKLNEFDWIVYWSGIAAGALQPALFVHFALAFPEERRRWHKSLIGVTYFPGIIVVCLQVLALEAWSATEVLRHRLDQIAVGYTALFYVLAAVIFFVNYRHTNAPLRRQQLKWLTRGTVLAVAPFTLLSAIPFMADMSVPDALTKIAGLCLIFLPLTFSWAIIRYRLVDVDLIFKRGVTYTLATATLVGLYFALVAVAAELVHTRLPSAGPWGLLAAIIITAQLFDPLKKMIQDRVDRVFDRKRYDYRTTLIDFGRGLSSQTDLNALLNAIVDRLLKTLLVERVAVFLSERSGDYHLAAAHGLPKTLYGQEAVLDFGFLDFDQPDAGSHVFLENTQQTLYLTESERRSAALLDLNYYLPCRVQDRTIAVIGFGRTSGGDFLSSEDVELLESLASYIGIALQNALLYASLELKISEYERLKEFNENIVESINVGILAVDLKEQVESWNSQMEVLFALPRGEALRQPLSSVFSESLMEEYQRVRDDPGVHNLYKFRLETKTGESRTVNVAIAPLIARDFQIVGRIILIDDITDRTELEAQLSQAEKLSSIGLLAAGVAHEVNTPLAVISSYTQMLTKQVRGDDRLSPLLEKITQQTFRASEIVNGLLNFSRTGSTEFRETNVNAIIHDTLTLLEHQFKTAQVRVDIALAPELPPILGNAGKLQQVFLNLFLNAKDAMTGGGRLRIMTEANGHVGIAITDSGSGIAPEHLQKIYDPFFTTKTSPKEGQRRGTGLGLAVTYGIIQEHAGKIHVESEVGSGTTFYLEFPMLRKPAHV
ncbi:ATP-binding protein [Paracidobacterium acidisoli]|uniref:histidine kinase n=1 Tax=Paracidobacterium acidisoli TaxID=2303751 RepID=A0A372ISA4_9BACT|nr:ATP-binding protein [Paracidobacterium acidisoli]MBT9330779.1 GAF domain-containing protein [Paracidobacterium acidisoli]